MKVLLAIAVVALAAAVSARPGGYTSNGGVYNPDKHLDYMDHARNAGKLAPFAWTSLCVCTGYPRFVSSG